MLKRVDTSVFATAEAAANGEFTGGFVTYDLSTDGVGYSTEGGYLDDVQHGRWTAYSDEKSPPTGMPSLTLSTYATIKASRKGGTDMPM